MDYAVTTEQTSIATPRVLSVGQCVPDQAAIRNYVHRHYGAEVVGAEKTDDAMTALREARRAGRPFQVVMVNRKLDCDYTDGLLVLKTIKADIELCETPVMLVSNYPEAHEQAVAAGGVPGFGKLELAGESPLSALAPHLGPPRC